MKLFVEMNDQIFYEGYTETLSISDPSRFEFEWKEFLQMFK